MKSIHMTSHIDLKELFKFYNCSMNSLVNIQIGYDARVYILLSAHIPERIQGMFVDTKANTEYSAIRLSVDWGSGEVVHHELLEFGTHKMNFHFIQPIGENILLLGARCRYYENPGPEKNAVIVDVMGNVVKEFCLGDGIQDCIVTDSGDIISSYFDEGVFGNFGWDQPIGSCGLIVWSQNGEIKCYKRRSPMYNKVYIEISNICNMNCSFCHGHKRPLRRMTIEEFALILNKLTDQTGYLYYHLMGEPLTHPQLPEFIKLAGERGYKSIITTNGTLLKKRGQELLAAGVHKINISLHSFEKGSDEDYKKYLCNLADFAKEAENQGTIVIFRLWNKGFDEGKNQVAHDFLKEKIPGDWVESPRGIRIRNKIYLAGGERFEWPDSEAEIKGDRFFCYGLKDQFGILADGTVVPCCLDSDGVIHLGNILEQDIESILNSSRAKNLIEGFKCGVATEELCKRCGYAQRFV